ncbi:MAG: DUF2220 domain-containing protein [Treponema sp.]|jgi:hypothetical protein|nr:DUF2220 domain-containing protein [Treponema sp.]
MKPDRPGGHSPLTVWEKRIIGAFIERYPASAAASLDGGASGAAASAAPPAGPGGVPAEAAPPLKTPRPQRLRPDRIFPGLDRSSPDERESFLEAAEALEGRGLLSLIWARHRKGETLSALVCRNPELLHELAGKPSPKITAEKVRQTARLFAVTAEVYHKDTGGAVDKAGAPEAALFSFIAEHFTPQDAAGGIDVITLTELVRLTNFLFDRDTTEGIQREGFPPKNSRPENLPPGKARGITTRALSAALYGDSKRLETLLSLFDPLFSRARRRGIAIPDFSFLDRSYPETFIAGKIVFEWKEDIPAGGTPLVNAAGGIVGLPLETILKLRRLRPLAGEGRGLMRVLMIENKETFFALSQSLPSYACFLYAGGHPNRAVRALALLLAESGFAFSHAGDLDPDGILILQELAEITGKEVSPLLMDAATFDRYLECGRTLEPSMLKRTALIGEKTRSIPGMAELIRRIEETGMGVEQEIIDYREAVSYRQ